jgi:hypothetical protein
MVIVPSHPQAAPSAHPSLTARPHTHTQTRARDCTSCPPGQWSSTPKASQCTGTCRAGYYCPLRSTSGTANECGSPAVFCPAGSGIPTPVSAGYYTTGGGSATTASAQAPCEPGSYCASGVRTACPAGTFGASAGLTTGTCSGVCPAGRYSTAGSLACDQCPADTFSAEGVATCTPCPVGQTSDPGAGECKPATGCSGLDTDQDG